MTTLATKPKQKAQLARPLKVLVPLIKDELTAGDGAGLEHYRLAGEMLLEAREQVAEFKWTAWLSKNFALSRTTAWRYMRLAERIQDDPVVSRAETSLRRALGQSNGHERRSAWREVGAAARKIPRDEFAQERQARDGEMDLHRALALELIDIGYRALATRLHPDKGGSKDAMRRLNRVRAELNAVAKTRRFE